MVLVSFLHLMVGPHATLSPLFKTLSVSPPHALPLTLSLSLPLHVCLSIPFFSAFTLQRALHFTGTMDERLGPSARADKTTLTHTHTHTPSQILTYTQMEKQRDEHIQRCITKPINAHSSEHTLRGGKKCKHSIKHKKHTHTHITARQLLCRTHALQPLKHILHVKREKKKRKRGRDEMKEDAKKV